MRCTQFGQVAVAGPFGRPFVQIVPAGRIGMGEIVDAAAHRPKELFVSRSQRTEGRRVAQVPLADQRGAVAGMAQQ
jgi:hypothetical protein